MIELRGFWKNRSFFRFFLFLSEIKALFCYFNRFFVEYLLSSLLACYWLIISDYFSSIFPMLNSHKKNGFCSKKVLQVVFNNVFNKLNSSVFNERICYDLSNENNLVAKVCLKKKFLTFWDGDKCYFFWDFLIYVMSSILSFSYPKCILYVVMNIFNIMQLSILRIFNG